LNDDLKQRIIAAIPIESYIGRYVKLKKTGKGFTGLCPFHQERSPSFHVRPDTGRFHCFGCGKDGDLFTFVMEKESLSFVQALDELARYAGIERTPGKEDPLKRYYDLNEQVLRLFRSHLKTDDVVQKYMESRSIHEDTAARFEMGSSPDSWNWLAESLDREGIRGKEELLKEMGLIRAKEEDRRTYDFFRGRVMFPIRDAVGRLCGFGGRALPGFDDRAKYINSQDSRVFHKQELLYGLYQSLKEIRPSREAILVEGYLDVIGLSQAGLSRAVAPLGTAFTESQLRLIEKYADTLVCMMDGDKAGRAAALKAVRLALEKGKLRVRVLLLPEGMDAFDLSVKTDAATILSLLALSFPGERYLIVETMFPGAAAIPAAEPGSEGLLRFGEHVRREYERKRMELDASSKRDGLARLDELVKTMPAELGQILKQEGSAIIGVSPDRARSPMQKRPTQGRTVMAPPLSNIAKCEREIVTIFMFHPTALVDLREEMDSFSFQDEPSEIMVRYLDTRAISGNLWTPETVFSDQLPDSIVSIFHGLLLSRAPSEDPVGVVRDLLVEHRIRSLEKEFEDLDLQLAGADLGRIWMHPQKRR
jgi:DNA primase